MSSSKPSTEFPAGNGDIRLLSTDGTLFHVHSTILQQSSTFFQTMFQIGPPEVDNSSKDERPLNIDANAETLDLLLRSVYPNRENPEFNDLQTLASVLRVAKRYEMDAISQQLGRTMLANRIVNDKILPPFYISSPIPTLAIAYAFDCNLVARCALRECLTGEISTHFAQGKDFDLPVELINHILKLRKERSDWFRARVEMHQTGWPTNECESCEKIRSYWKTEIALYLDRNLDVDYFKATVHDEWNCLCAKQHRSVFVPHSDAKGWLEEWSELSTKLPAL
ncbi:hypothetical protein FRC14_000740 [Serendipita sp. 396]|nr:hypothetical protein FRC14_000740 [Serendipita sp. 396]KAG8785500.1 hypothetical protein FRC15_001239 [Serendipita sp. 397]KAG8801393.1 hypothetical protein FRC16_000592 [Serendipita sp. 398]KAG8812666.1 hypothetical protein FRC19_002997 [Serendipita sp. 401]KAG8830406.1 hypothetical protein FRC18_008141 [Serendipita sp. 400]KAG8846513.1 hypothetical protein FRB91_000718 [Serendipita sp. 411]KAG8869455.1 hypothetical protein FRC20_001432 [Serendipita sp. 405]KAG9022042.1 hypothetical prot